MKKSSDNMEAPMKNAQNWIDEVMNTRMDFNAEEPQKSLRSHTLAAMKNARNSDVMVVRWLAGVAAAFALLTAFNLILLQQTGSSDSTAQAFVSQQQTLSLTFDE